jgi:hypothetical protein
MVAATTPTNMYMFDQKVQDGLLQFCKSTQEVTFGKLDLRTRFQFIDKEYIRENNLAVDQAAQSKAANSLGDKRKIQDIVIPIVEPQTESALAFLSSVFLTGYPIFGVVANKDNMDQAKVFETLIGNQAIQGGWVRQFLMFFRDGLKYNFHALEVDWCTEKTYSLKTDAQFSTKEAKPTEVTWQGNRLRRRDPYNVFYDPRIPITEQHRYAEYVGYVELYNRVGLAQFLQALPWRMNVTKAYESTPQLYSGMQALYYIPDVFTENISLGALRNIMNWDSWAIGGTGRAGNDPRLGFKNMYHVVTRYIRLIPSDFSMRVPNRGQAQIWKIITVNDAHIVYLERQTNAHNYLPIIFGQPIEDGLNLQTKSFAQKQIPMQDIASALANSKLAARRRLIADRALYDPSRIREADINSDNPAAKIPVRPTAYGQDLSKSFHQIPFRDEQTGTLMNDVREVMGYADYLSGQNRAQQGQFVKGNKTKSEYDDVTRNSSGRQQTMALNIEYQVMGPVKEILKLNILQYQPSGQIYSYETQKPYNVDPVQLREQSLIFKVSDGVLPSDKIMESSTLEVAMQVVGQSQQLSQEYNVGDIFADLMKTRSVDISAYKWTPQQKQDMQNAKIQQVQAEAAAQATAKGVAPNGTPIQ